MEKSQDSTSISDNPIAVNLPSHVGFIVDGNRRWARERNLPTLEGHRRGFAKLEDIAEAVIEKGVPYASFYVFSTENWSRSEEEVAYLMDLLRKNITRLSRKLQRKNIKMIVMGKAEPAPIDVLQSLKEAEELTRDGTAGTICICFNYGGHWEIADAVTQILTQYQSGDAITPEIIEQFIYHPEIPACDLIVRTSGEERISGFQLWRAAYSEFLFMPKYFPDIEVSDLDDIIAEYQSRQRRFGH